RGPARAWRGGGGDAASGVSLVLGAQQHPEVELAALDRGQRIGARGVEALPGARAGAQHVVDQPRTAGERGVDLLRGELHRLAGEVHVCAREDAVHAHGVRDRGEVEVAGRQGAVRRLVAGDALRGDDGADRRLEVDDLALRLGEVQVVRG